jgi:hypothetical protein
MFLISFDMKYGMILYQNFVSFMGYHKKNSFMPCAGYSVLHHTQNVIQLSMSAYDLQRAMFPILKEPDAGWNRNEPIRIASAPPRPTLIKKEKNFFFIN